MATRRGLSKLRAWLFVAGVGGPLSLGLVWCTTLFAHPRVDQRTSVDAVYVLGPLETRARAAEQLMASGVAPVMIATTSINEETGERYFTHLCGQQRQGYRIECVEPEPYDTRGEARLLGRLVQERGYKRVAVFTSTPHLSRARLLMERCTDADVLMWDYKRERSLPEWLGEFVHQSGGWAEAQLQTDC